MIAFASQFEPERRIVDTSPIFHPAFEPAIKKAVDAMLADLVKDSPNLVLVACHICGERRPLGQPCRCGR